MCVCVYVCVKKIDPHKHTHTSFPLPFTILWLNYGKTLPSVCCPPLLLSLSPPLHSSVCMRGETFLQLHNCKVQKTAALAQKHGTNLRWHSDGAATEGSGRKIARKHKGFSGLSLVIWADAVANSSRCFTFFSFIKSSIYAPGSKIYIWYFYLFFVFVPVRTN